MLICLRRRRTAVAAQTENDAEEPRPAPTGRVARALKLNARLFFSVSRSMHGRMSREKRKNIVKERERFHYLSPVVSKRYKC